MICLYTNSTRQLTGLLAHPFLLRLFAAHAAGGACERVFEHFFGHFGEST